MIKTYVFAGFDFIVSKRDEVYVIEANLSPWDLKWDSNLIDKKGRKIFDLIVVFSEYIAKSAKDRSYKEENPFSGKYDIYNDSYSYFLLKCKEAGIKVAFTTSKDIIGPGLFQSFWTYDKEWIRNEHKAYSEAIFDRFGRINSGQRNKLKLLTSSRSIRIFNKKTVRLFGNKLNTYKYFKEFIIPTIEIKICSKKNIYLAKARLDKLLKKHKHREDFNSGYIIKRKYGSSGKGIFKVNFDGHLKEIGERRKLDVKKGRLVSYILQPFINCDKGFVFGEYNGFIDLRVVLINHEIIQTYIRIAKKGDFRCNIHQGGNLVSLSKKMIPKDVLAMIQKIIIKLNLKLKHSLYTLDFIRSNNGNLYLIEGNSKPGIDWEHKNKVDEIQSKELISLIVDELKSFVIE